MSEAVKVMVRARPQNSREKGLNAVKIIEVFEDKGEITIYNPAEKENKKTFTFDAVFDENSKQSVVYSNLPSESLTIYSKDTTVLFLPTGRQAVVKHFL